MPDESTFNIDDFLQESAKKGYGEVTTDNPSDGFITDDPAIKSLASYGLTAWEAAKNSKTEIERRLFKSERIRRGEYDPEELEAIRLFGGSAVYMLLGSMKCRAAKSWITDIMIPVGENIGSVEPTPVPELAGSKLDTIREIVTSEASTILVENPEQPVTPAMVEDRMDFYRDMVLTQERIKAKKVAVEQTDYMQDQLVEGGFYDALKSAIDDFCTYQAAFIKGPIVYSDPVTVWDDDNNFSVKRKEKRYWERVSPFDIYLSPGSRTLNDGYLIERLRLRRKDLNSFIGVDGFDEETIRTILKEYGQASFTENWLWTDQERANLASRTNEQMDPDALIECLSIWADIQGSMLIEWGFSEDDVPDPDIDYAVNFYLAGEYVFMARLNPNPMGNRPYFSAAYDPHPESVWAQNSLPETIADCCKMCNAAARACANNMSFASGPQVEVDVSRIDPAEDIEQIIPLRIWRTTRDAAGSGRPAVNFYQPTMNADPLLKIFKHFYDQASEQSGIPNYVYGSEKVGGAGSTARGLSMLMNAAGKTLKNLVFSIDRGIVIPAFKTLWVDIMLNPDDNVPKKGDVKIIARASDSLIVGEQLASLRQEFLNFTSNPIDRQIMGVDGRAALLREQSKELKMPDGEVIPSKQDLQSRMQQQAMNMRPEEETGVA